MEKSSFFNSMAGDRKYSASDFAAYFNSLVTNGVFPVPSNNLQVIANNDMTVTIKAGKAFIDGYIYINDADLILNIGTADGILKRIDRVVVKFDALGRLISASVKAGSLASSPVAPTLQRDSDVYELGMADIYIAAGATSIVQANITDTRLNTILCGVVNSLIQADTTAIFDQYQDWFNTKTAEYQASMSATETSLETSFNTWFSGIQGDLGSDLAGNLQLQVNALSAEIGTNADDIAANKSQIDSMCSLVVYFARQTAPTGYLKANGAAVSRTVYADLFSNIGTFFGAGDGSTTFNVPDGRGLFVRGFDDGAGIDTGRVFGSIQQDDIKLHRHTIYSQNQGTGYSADGALLSADPIIGGGNPPQQYSGYVGGTETRPKNMSLLACIKY